MSCSTCELSDCSALTHSLMYVAALLGCAALRVEPLSFWPRASAAGAVSAHVSVSVADVQEGLFS